MYIICIKDLISIKWRQVIIPLFENSIIMNLNNIYTICIKDMILNKLIQISKRLNIGLAVYTAANLGA